MKIGVIGGVKIFKYQYPCYSRNEMKLEEANLARLCVSMANAAASMKIMKMWL
jgi:hypothetical protein